MRWWIETRHIGQLTNDALLVRQEVAIDRCANWRHEILFVGEKEARGRHRVQRNSHGRVLPWEVNPPILAKKRTPTRGHPVRRAVHGSF